MLSVAGIFLKNREHRGYLAPRKSFCPFCRGGVRVRCHPGSPARHQLHSRNCPSRSAPSALNLDPEIWQSSSSSWSSSSSIQWTSAPPKEPDFPQQFCSAGLRARYRQPRERGRRRARARVPNFGLYAKHVLRDGADLESSNRR